MWNFSAFNTSDFGPRGTEEYTGPIKYNDTEVEGWKETCVFPGWKEDEFPYEHEADYYFVWMGRLAFLVMFQVSLKVKPRKVGYIYLYRMWCME